MKINIGVGIIYELFRLNDYKLTYSKKLKEGGINEKYKN